MCGKRSIGVCCQNFGGFLGVWSALGMIYTIAVPDWHRLITRELDNGYYSYDKSYHGLWMRCIRTPSDSIQCDRYLPNTIYVTSNIFVFRCYVCRL